MIYILIGLLIIFLVSFIVYMLNLIRQRMISIDDNPNRSIERLDLSRWRGGVRYPAGYYKNETDFYESEKRINYPR